MEKSRAEKSWLEGKSWKIQGEPIKILEKYVKKKSQKPELKVPFIPNVPLSWIQGVLFSQGKTTSVKLALFIWFKRSLLQSKTNLVISSTQAQEQFGVVKCHLSRNLKELEVSEMIERIDQRQGKSPRVTVLSKEKRGEPFIPSIPLPWIQPALFLPGKAVAVKMALYIWREKGLPDTEKEFVLSSVQAYEDFGISSRAFSRALKELESLEMIKIISHGRGESTRVRVLWEEEG